MKAEIKNHNGLPALFINDKVYPPMMATIRTIDNDNIVFDEEYFKCLGEAGIRIFFVICDTKWLKKDAIKLFDKEARALLKAIPDAYIVPRIGLHPTNEWLEENLDDVLTYSDGSKPGYSLYTESYRKELPHVYSMVSEKWHNDAGQALKETWNELMNMPYAERIIGCFFAAGGTSEWYSMHTPCKENLTLDHSKAFKKYFSFFLKNKYKTDKELQTSWKNKSVTLDNPIIPDSEGHYFYTECDKAYGEPKGMVANSPEVPVYTNGSNIGTFLDVNNRMDVYDFYRAWHDGTADAILHFGKIIKELTPNRLTGVFYGALGCTDFIGGGTNGGILKILNSDKIDFLSAPGVYENRQPGGMEGQRELIDSIILHNKLFILEEDTRTHMENRFYASKYEMFDVADSIDVMKREFGRTICQGNHGWWFDQLIGGKRYKHPELYKLIEIQQNIAKEAYSKDRTKCSEIAFIYDSESVQTVSSQTSRELIELHRNYEIDRIGAPVDLYYHNDFIFDNMPSYKMYVFFNTFVLSDEERRHIRQKLSRENATAVFMYGSGVINFDKNIYFDAANIESLTGIKTTMLNENHSPKFRFCDIDHPMTQMLDKREVYGHFKRKRMLHGASINPLQYWESCLSPVFVPDDSEAVVLARYAATGIPAIVIKETDGFISIFCGAKYLTSDVWREIAKYSGCHIYCYSDDVTYVNKNYIVFHSSSKGIKRLEFSQKVSLYEVYENKYYLENSNTAEFDCYFGETKMFRIEKK